MIKYLKLKKRYVPEVCAVHKRCVLITNSKYYNQEAINNWVNQITEENIKTQMSTSLWYIMLIRDKIIGFAQISFEEKALYQLNIDPDFQGKGYGTMFYRFIENQFKKYGVDSILIQSTINAVPFYLKLGFKILQNIELPVGDAVIEMTKMKKDLRM